MVAGTRLLTADRLDAAAEDLAVAFADDPLMAWIHRDEARRPVALRAWTAATVRRGLDIGWTHLLADGGGVAVWSPPDVPLYDEATNTELFAELQRDVAWAEVVGGAFARVREHRPDGPYFYLGWLGVVPERQGRGAGARLLSRTLEVCDAEGHVAHLMSSNPRNLGLYLRHGFEIDASLELDDGGPVVTPMTRRPR